MCVNNWFKIVCCSSFSCSTRTDKNAFGSSCLWQEFMMACCASWTLGLWQLEFRAACDAYCKTVMFGKRSGLHVALVFNFFQLIMASNYSHRETHWRVKALTIWNERILLCLRTAALFRICLRAGAALLRLVTCCSCSFALGNLNKDVFEQRTLGWFSKRTGSWRLRTQIKQLANGTEWHSGKLGTGSRV